MAYLYNSAEGQTTGTTLTAANSGGNSGDAFPTVTNVGTPTNEFSSTHAANGSMSYHIAGTGTDRINVHHGESVGYTSGAYGYNLYFPSLPIAGNLVQLSVFINTAFGPAGYITLQPSGQLRIYDSVNTVMYTTTVNLSINTWYHIDHQVTIDTTSTGTINFRVCPLGSTTPLDSYNSTTANCGTSKVMKYMFGKINTGGDVFDLYYDDLTWQSDTTDFITPGATPLMWTI